MSRKKLTQLTAEKFIAGINVLLIPITLALVILAGHYGIFWGHSFVMEEDHVKVCFSTAVHGESSWDLFKGFGGSIFSGDPGSDFGWSLFDYWNKLFDDYHAACKGSILFLMWVITLTQYYFLRHIFPDLNRWIILPLSLIIIFGSLRYEYIFLRVWTFIFIAVPILSLTLYYFLKTYKPHYFFLYVLTHFCSLFLGSGLVSQFSIGFSILFFIIYVFFHRIHKDYKKLVPLFARFFFMNLVTGIAIILLGSWFFYGFFYEMWIFPQQRTTSTVITNSVFADVQLTTIISGVISYLQSGLISHSSGILGYNQTNLINGWYFPSPLFPVLILPALLCSTRIFWEYAAKFIVVFILFFDLLVQYIPGVNNFLPTFLTEVSEFYPILQIYEIVLLAFLIQRIIQEKFQFSFLAKQIVKVVSAGLAIFYISLFLFSVAVKIFPDTLKFFLMETSQKGLAEYISVEKMGLITKLIPANLVLLNETWGWDTLIFFGSTGIVFIYFTRISWPRVLIFNNPRFFAIFLLVNTVLFSWSVYPINSDLSILNKNTFLEKPFPVTFKPFDRFALIGVPKCVSSSNYAECVQVKFFNDQYGDRRWIVGYNDIQFPFVNKPVHLIPKNHAELIEEFYEMEGITVHNPVKDFIGSPPRPKMRLFDLTATRYLISEYPLDPFFELEHIKLLYSKKQFYLYQNTKALPYFYLANQIETIDNYADLYDIRPGVGFIWQNDLLSFSQFMAAKKSGQVELVKFEKDRVEFRTQSRNPEFLVVADAWHPQGRVKVDGLDSNLYQANGVFKGVFISKGNHEIEFYFDDSPYKLGVWISLTAWLLFLGSWLAIIKKESFRTC
jgi:hypothetical protein